MTLDPKQLAERQDVVDVCITYALALDSKDWDRLRGVFLPDAVADYGMDLGISEGYDVIEAACRGALEPLTATQHLMGNHLVVFTDAGADATTYFQATHKNDRVAGVDIFTIAGRYDDKLVRTEGGWKIAHKTLTTMWTSGNPEVIGAA